MDVRANNPARPSGTVDKERDVIRLSNSSDVQGEDRTLSVAVDGWENSKMKKKRTGIKLDVAANSVAAKPVDSYRETKQGTHPRLPTEARSRMTDAHGFRSSSASGGLGVVKAEATSQTSSGMRSSVSRTDSDNSSILHERRERLSGQEKERVNLKAVNRANSREDFCSGSPTSGSKLNANIRAPRSGSVGGVSKLSQVVQRSASPNEWELSNYTNKIPGSLGANSRKRTPSARSSSPVSSWVQRSQKISRTARRTNLLPIVPGNDEDPVVHATSDMMVNERRFGAHSPQQVKLKRDNFSPAALSESEESGAAENKSRDKNKKCDDIDERSGQNVQKMSTLLLPPRKNKAVGDSHGDGVRRQGRTGRGFTSSRSLLPLSVEKIGNVGTTKQIRSSRPGLDKTERAGRPPTRKLSDRKAHTRQKHITISTGADFLVGSDDGHDELLAAANAVTNTAQALCSPLWKKMEPLFRFISDVDISYLNDQVNPGLVVDTPAPVPLDAGSSTLMANGCGSNEFGKEENEARNVELSPEHLVLGAKIPNEIPLYQRLIAALIPEEGSQVLLCSGKEDVEYDVYGSRFGMENDIESDSFCSRLSPGSNGYSVNYKGRSFYEMEHSIISISDTGVSAHHSQNGSLSDQSIPDSVCSEYQYHDMAMNERLLMEIHSIGIYPDLVSGDEEVSRDISRLDEKYQEQVSRTKSLLGKLLSSASEAKELQEKEFEELALDKLLVMAYEKYMNCWGPNAHGMKSASGKMAKQAALAFVRRALERYQEFKATGKSCFDDPLYKDIFLSAVSRLMDMSSSTDKESGKLQVGTSGCSAEVRTLASVGTQQSPTSDNQDTYSSEAFLLGSEQNTGKEDSGSNRLKRRELLLDDVGGTISTAPGVPSGLGGSLSCSAKGKRSGRDREGKGNSREIVSRSGNTKSSRSASTSVKGERKSKAKPKQKTTHLSASVNGPLGKMADQPKEMFNSTEISGSDGGAKAKNDHSTDMLEEPIDLSGLQLPEMDDLGGAGDLGGQGEDIGSWLNFEDDGLHDHDYMGGLEIPMDDLSDLNMLV
ncbi:hypothetical protein CDL12_07461 [Handroanthus impetiginosus]|uniref:Uncharacterized protein n=1 Tax=Handroanthus impetiginosus TaxID=429701 RepID=A0A2G9HQN3_9LAMI|nr:hypothetical protein CDL12_07461 [Handroanthus impetiginosus]